jgi:hypothetical protein
MIERLHGMRNSMAPRLWLCLFGALLVIALFALPDEPVVAQGLVTIGTQRADPSFAPFEGFWSRRDALLVVSEDGVARFRWKTGVCYPENNLEPCDEFIGGRLFMGGLVEIVLTSIDAGSPSIARGHATLTNRPDMFLRGSGLALVRTSDDLILIDWSGGQRTWLCRPPREPNTCDAP